MSSDAGRSTSRCHFERSRFGVSHGLISDNWEPSNKSTTLRYCKKTTATTSSGAAELCSKYAVLAGPKICDISVSHLVHGVGSSSVGSELRVSATVALQPGLGFRGFAFYLLLKFWKLVQFTFSP